MASSFVLVALQLNSVAFAVAVKVVGSVIVTLTVFVQSLLSFT